MAEVHAAFDCEAKSGGMKQKAEAAQGGSRSQRSGIQRPATDLPEGGSASAEEEAEEADQPVAFPALSRFRSAIA